MYRKVEMGSRMEKRKELILVIKNGEGVEKKEG
jgi:hypothetical protein